MQPFVGVGRGHAHIGDDDVGTVFGDGGGQRLGVAHGGDDLVADAGQERDDPFAQQDGVVGEGYAEHGVSCRMEGPVAAWLVPRGG